ncbi:MAG: hypothetical protein U5N85_23320 [Arcicella sp.]|nr:hypothetical protein [Arcicella sp.]
MLNYQELSRKFTEKLNSFDKDFLLKWIEFDQYRDTIAQLVSGETVKVKNTTLTQNILVDNKEKVALTGNTQYAMAA